MTKWRRVGETSGCLECGFLDGVEVLGVVGEGGGVNKEWCCGGVLYVRGWERGGRGLILFLTSVPAPQHISQNVQRSFNQGFLNS